MHSGSLGSKCGECELVEDRGLALMSVNKSRSTAATAQRQIWSERSEHKKEEQGQTER